MTHDRYNFSLVQEVVPSMEEVGLLRDALKQLDQPFLMVVVGEFNSGKSTVINALLGRRFLAEGILPTTNEISVLKFRSSHCHTPLCFLYQLIAQQDHDLMQYCHSHLLHRKLLQVASGCGSIA